jgi:ankyrin repeat protein
MTTLNEYKEFVQWLASDVSVLHKACEKGKVKYVKLLLDHNADINRCKNWTKPLETACEYNQIEVVKLLLQNNPNRSNIKGNHSDLRIVCQKGHIEIFKILLENNITKKLPLEKPCLGIAFNNDNTEIAKLLLDLDIYTKGDIDYIDNTFVSLCYKGRIEYVEMFLEYFPDTINQKNLLYSVYKCDIVMFRYLIDKGVDINDAKYMRTPLDKCCEWENFERVQLLIEAGATIKGHTYWFSSVFIPHIQKSNLVVDLLYTYLRKYSIPTVLTTLIGEYVINTHIKF